MQQKLDELKNQMAWALVRNHRQHNMSSDCMDLIKIPNSQPDLIDLLIILYF